MPRLGLAFLISAPTARRPAAIRARSAPSNCRAGGIERAADSISLDGRARFAAVISSAFVARIRPRMSELRTGSAGRRALLLRESDERVELAPRGTRGDCGARPLDSLGNRRRDVGG